jgi:tRNA(Ile)-lysidine synthase TilS/MesJ
MNLYIPTAQPPWTTLGKELESRVRKAIHDFSLLPSKVTHLGIALSGGKDSLSLLFLLASLRQRGFPNFRLTAFHIFGPFSCGSGIDRPLLQAICGKLNVDFVIRETHQTKETLECYSCSRTRRSLLFAAAKEYGVDFLAFGHHRDDSVQTLLMNLLHKGEFAANLPKVQMHHYGVTIIRPLIYVEEEMLAQFAKQYQFARVVCQCPVGQRSKRKQVKDLLRQVEPLFPHAASNLAKAGLLYGSDKASLP